MRFDNVITEIEAENECLAHACKRGKIARFTIQTFSIPSSNFLYFG